MSRIERQFKKGPVFVGYITAGDGGLENTLQAAQALIKGGVSLLEIGVPFSDPIADGAVIQAASNRALQMGVTLDGILKLALELRKLTDIPMILFTYCNPLWSALQHDDFLSRVKAAGIDGFLIVDLPPEEAQEYCARCRAVNLATVFVVTPNTDLARAKVIAQDSTGFIYYACRAGTTGIKNDLPTDLPENILRFKQTTNLPIVVGFGVHERAQAQAILQYADGFVVGSYFVNAIAKGMQGEALTQLAREIFPTTLL